MLDGMRAIEERTAPTPTDRLDTAVRDWTRRRLQWSGVSLVCAVAACAALWTTALRTSAWRSDLLHTGRHTTGTVESISTGSGKFARTWATIDVDDAVTGAHFRMEHHGVALPYARGATVDVWYDPADTRHARTAFLANDNDPLTVASSVGAMVTFFVSAELSILFGYGVIAHRMLRAPLRPSAVTAVARRRVRRADHRALLAFRDTGAAVWSLHHHSRVARAGGVLVAGRGHWRLVAWPVDDRPYLCRRAWTASGRRAWARGLRYGGERP